MADESMFRVPPLRLLGLGLAAGEALAYVTGPRTVDICYMFGYGFAACHVGNALINDKNVLKTVMWESMASLLFPTLVVFHVSSLTWNVLQDAKFSKKARRWWPTLVGLGMAVMLQAPIDGLADDLCDSLFSKA